MIMGVLLLQGYIIISPVSNQDIIFASQVEQDGSLLWASVVLPVRHPLPSCIVSNPEQLQHMALKIVSRFC